MLRPDDLSGGGASCTGLRLEALTAEGTDRRVVASLTLAEVYHSWFNIFKPKICHFANSSPRFLLLFPWENGEYTRTEVNLPFYIKRRLRGRCQCHIVAKMWKIKAPDRSEFERNQKALFSRLANEMNMSSKQVILNTHHP